MNKIFIAVPVIIFYSYCHAQPFQLAPPRLEFGSVFFSGHATAILKFEQAGTRIFYTLTDNEPTENDILYKKPIVVQKNGTILRAKVFGKGFNPSETVQVTFIKDGLKIKSIQQTTPDEKFSGNGPGCLVDNKGGIADLHNKNFLGYRQVPVEINILLEKKEKIDSVLLDFLQDHNSWIFLPQEIGISYFNYETNAFESMMKQDIPGNTGNDKSSTVFEMLRPPRKIISDKLKILITPLQSLPEDHPGKGSPAWVFIDEIKIY